ncbi:pirin family protein [Acinetobacter qingfengensis]|uniref:Quercetin 2,3-dioxygenase n=1 Tax=Acinetobacter qingfengensis TaxID=1262585 RepID=A0A1E7QXP3_9GAMM|nr:pirin family protein [Acinetobacter qingfengensis]KAA8731714.1 pirin family protein [Acinetobacter qingfengensis]OEY91813.1 quercetin 2,3-dioxygenase [Acinetobacter qingfengensis]
MRKIIGTMHSQQIHWVGDGFPVKTLFSYDRLGQAISPFLLLDYAAPYYFAPTTQRHGVGSHPHRGFETVTLAYQGEVTHKDSSGGGGTIKTGDVQWMTAAAGLVHEEFHSTDFAAQGGNFEMVQLRVNLPAKSKMTTPKYQAIDAKIIPQLVLDEQGSYLRVIAGQYLERSGAATTFTPVNVWDGELKAATRHQFLVPTTHNAIFVVLSGQVLVNEMQQVNEHGIVIFARDGETGFNVQAVADSKFVLLTGEPLNEPIQGYGPFVMNTQLEITQAFDDFRQGKFGQIHVM